MLIFWARRCKAKLQDTLTLPRCMWVGNQNKYTKLCTWMLSDIAISAKIVILKLGSSSKCIRSRKTFLWQTLLHFRIQIKYKKIIQAVTSLITNYEILFLRKLPFLNAKFYIIWRQRILLSKQKQKLTFFEGEHSILKNHI